MSNEPIDIEKLYKIIDKSLNLTTDIVRDIIKISNKKMILPSTKEKLIKNHLRDLMLIQASTSANYISQVLIQPVLSQSYKETDKL